MEIFSSWSKIKDFESSLTAKQKPLFEEFKNEVEKEFSTVQKEVSDQAEMISTLNEELKNVEKAPAKPGKQVITIGKENLLIKLPKVRLSDGQVITVNDLKENKIKVQGKPVLDYLKSINSGMFSIVEK